MATAWEPTEKKTVCNEAQGPTHTAKLPGILITLLQAFTETLTLNQHWKHIRYGIMV